MIEVLDPRFRTADGLGVGSTLAHIRALHPNVEPIVGFAGPSVSLHDQALSFWFDPSSVHGSTVPANAAVIRVSVRSPGGTASSM